MFFNFWVGGCIGADFEGHVVFLFDFLKKLNPSISFPFSSAGLRSIRASGEGALPVAANSTAVYNPTGSEGEWRRPSDGSWEQDAVLRLMFYL